MASTKEYLNYVLEEINNPNVHYRPMMGEFILYYQDIVFGGVYDDRLLIKITPSSAKTFESAPKEIPYQGAKEMYLVEPQALETSLLEKISSEIPNKKSNKNV